MQDFQSKFRLLLSLLLFFFENNRRTYRNPIINITIKLIPDYLSSKEIFAELVLQNSQFMLETIGKLLDFACQNSGKTVGIT